MHTVIGTPMNANIISASESFIDTCCTQNVDYARTYDPKIDDAGAPPTEHLVIVCCMDARLDVFRMLGLKPGEAHIIRNGQLKFFSNSLFHVIDCPL